MDERTAVYLQNYRSMDTEELIKLQERGGLTDQATEALLHVLAERGVSAEQRLEISRAVQQEEELPRLASLTKRFYGQLIDGLVGLALAVIAYQIAGIFALRQNDKELLALATYLVYFLFADGLPSGQSLGKKFLKTAVVAKESGKPCGFVRSFFRNVAVIFGPLDWLWIFGDSRQRLGDYIAGTEVVNADFMRR